jgi:ribosomal protein S18 acetylase RimI-like enzyme
MQKNYEILIQEHATAEQEEVLLEGIIEAAKTAKGMSRIQPFCLMIKDGLNGIVAGAKGASIYGCLYIDLLWVRPELRRLKLGSKLMLAAEELALERKCTFMTVSTMDWEALPFYQKFGYEIEFVREGFEKDSKMFFLRKNLK